MSKKVIRVCHITNLTQMGGVERMLLDLLAYEQLKQDNKFIHYVASTSASREVISQYEDSGIDVYIPERKFKFDPFAIYYLSKWLKKNNIKIVHTYNNVSNCWGILASILARIDIKVTSEHGTAWDTIGWRFKLENFFLKFADKCLANSEASKTILENKYGVKERKIRVVHNGVDFSKVKSNFILSREEFGVKENHILIGTVGRIDYPKYHKLILDLAVLSKKKDLDYQYMIVGDGPLLKTLKEQARDLGLLDTVIFTGWRNDARDIIGLFDIYLSTSYRESFGNSLVEAANQKKAIVAPKIDGITDIFEDQVHAILIEPTVSVNKTNVPKEKLPEFSYRDGAMKEVEVLDERVILKAIKSLMENEKMKEDLANNAYGRVFNEFSITSYSERLTNTYNQILER